MELSPAKKILIIDAGPGYGGHATFLNYLLYNIDRTKFQPTVAFYYYNNSPETQKTKKLGIPVFFLNHKNYRQIVTSISGKKIPLPYNIRVFLTFLTELLIEIPLIWKVIKLIKRKAIDLVVLNNDVHYHFAGTFGARIARVPCVCRKAGGIGENRKLKKVLTSCISLFIAVSKATAEDQLMYYPSTKRLVMVYEGVDLKMFNSRSHCSNSHYSDEKKKLGIPPTKKVVGNISRFAKGKGQSELLEAAAIVVKNYPEVVFLMIGDGEVMDELQAKSKELNLANNVLFTGWRNDVSKILPVIDIFVHCPTTWIEGLGIANLEAMAMGKPTIVTNNGGLPDVVINGVNGFIVPIGDTLELANSILKLLVNEELSRKFGENGRKRIEDHFDIEKNVRKLEVLFEDIE